MIQIFDFLFYLRSSELLSLKVCCNGDQITKAQRM